MSEMHPNVDDQLNEVEKKIVQKLKYIVYDLTQKLEFANSKYFEADYAAKRSEEKYKDYFLVIYNSIKLT